MRDWLSLQKRYLRDELPVRLGGLAANLARVNSFSDHPDHRDIVKDLLEESKFFIEWTAPDTGVELQAELVNLQIQLAHWELNWANIWSDPVKRTGVAEQARVWSEQLLEISGLLGK